MIHIMKLKEKYYDYIKYGTKEYEIRLNDEKRKNIKKGDFIEFQKEPLLEEKMIIVVEDLIYYNNFSELFNDIRIDLLADSSVKKEKLENDLEVFYPYEKQKEYGVVAIKLNKNNIINNSNINSLSLDNDIFEYLRNNYNYFDTWFTKMQLNDINMYYTELNDKITSILILKINETDSQQFFEKGNILKIRTFLVKDQNKGIGTIYLKFVENIAKLNNIDYIYLTVKKDNKDFIDFIEKKGFKRYNQFNNELVYFKEL